jgi:hypothetical protein
LRIRRKTLLLMSLCLVAAAARGSAAAPRALTLHDIQAISTHNSYEKPLHTALTTQLGDEGVRGLELDVWWDPDTDRFNVRHNLQNFPEQNCAVLRECLSELAAWSSANRSHVPVAVYVELKQTDNEYVPAFIQLYKNLGLYERLDADIREGLGQGRLFTPDDLQRDRASVAEALRTDGWPSLDAMRGRVLVVLSHPEHRATYTRADVGPPTLAGRAMFVVGTLDGTYEPVTAMFSHTDPGLIRSAVAKGLIVRSAAGTTQQLTVALDAGAHYVNTDCPAADRGCAVGFVAEIPGGAPVGCNRVTAPADCTARRLENLGAGAR